MTKLNGPRTTGVFFDEALDYAELEERALFAAGRRAGALGMAGFIHGIDWGVSDSHIGRLFDIIEGRYVSFQHRADCCIPILPPPESLIPSRPRAFIPQCVAAQVLS